MPYLVAVAACAQPRALKRSLQDEGFSVYTPLFKDRRVVRGAVRWVEGFLLGPYVLVKHVADDAWKRIPSLKHCSGLFMHPDQPTPALVRDAEVDAIRKREDRGGYVQDAERVKFKRNTAVSPQWGVFAGFEGRYANVGRDGCDVALLSLMGRQVALEFAPGNLRAV